MSGTAPAPSPSPLAAAGATVHDHAADAVRHADIAISLLESGPVVAQVLFSQGAAAQALRLGSLFIDMASIQPREARAHAEQLQAQGVACLDAPVSGGTVGAEAGTLAIMVGGHATDYERALPSLPHWAALRTGPHGAGQLAKLANQMIVGITIGAVAEALLLAAKGGADMAKVREAISGGFADSRIPVHGQRMLERDYRRGAGARVCSSKICATLCHRPELGFDAPVTALLESLYAQAAAWPGRSAQSGLFVELAGRNGMQ